MKKSVQDFDNPWKELEEPKTMPFVTTFEKWGRRDGIEIGRKRAERELKRTLREFICDMLDVRFAPVPMKLKRSVNRVAVISKLKALSKLAKEIDSLDDFKI